MKKLDPVLYSLPATELAPLLLGKLLCVNNDIKVIRLRITETEAYYGESDTACHAHKGRTPRTEILYKEGGRVYVYLCYGIHSLINIISGNAGHPEGVLIRGVEGFDGPGKLTKYMGIDRTFNDISAIDSDRVWIEDDGFSPDKIYSSPRIGIDYATKEYRDKHWRFFIKLDD